MPRCCYRHDAFRQGGYRHDGSDQCWMMDVGRFKCGKETDAAKHYCIFHAPDDESPIDRDDWSIEKRGKAQGTQLRALLDEWNEENARRAGEGRSTLAFLMPGLRCGAAEFHGYKFSGPIICCAASFNGNAEFDSATFVGDAGFDAATFNCQITRFDSATFNGDARFGSAVFIGNARFDSATFCCDARFGRASFNGGARFDSAVFIDAAKFDLTSFINSSQFDSASFRGAARFGSASFSGSARFENASFSGSAWFGAATFIGPTQFGSATFDCVARFDSSNFSGSTQFSAATFRRDAWFSSSTFRGDAGFESVAFGQSGVFINCKFCSATSFANSCFSQAPVFHGATLHQGTDFRGAVFEDRTSREAPLAYRTLKLAMGDVQSRQEEARFHALEQESRRHQPDTPVAVKLSSLLYEKLSNYGQSFLRPLGWLGGSSVFFWLAYSLVLYFVENLAAPVTFLTDFTVRQIVRPFDAWAADGMRSLGEYLSTRGLPPISGDVAFTIKMLAAFQSLSALVFVTLFLLAVRREFKLD